MSLAILTVHFFHSSSSKTLRNRTLTALLCLACVNLAAQTIVPTPADGDTILTIVTAGAPVGANIAVFMAIPPAACSSAATPVALAPNTSNTVLGGTQTTVLLKEPVSEGQLLCASITPAGAAAIPVPTITVDPPAIPPGFDWGLVRAYFTLGALTSQERDQFSHQDMFLSFHLDKTYKMPGTLSAAGKHSLKPGLNSYFETRLTSVPVAVTQCSTAAGSSASTSASNSCANSNTGTAAPPAAAPATADTFLNSQKSARLIFGAYTPFVLAPWTVKSTKPGGSVTSTDYALFFAPLVKVGFDTTINGLNQTQQNSSTPDQVKAIGGSNQF